MPLRELWSWYDEAKYILKGARDIEEELRNVSDRKLRSIVQAWDRKVSWWNKHSIVADCWRDAKWGKRDFRYFTAKELLLGNLNWKEVDKARQIEAQIRRKDGGYLGEEL